jgi:hypothetical protein
MGLTESSLNTIIKPFSFLSHCKVKCDSPCCQSLCGDNNHCNCEVDTTDDTSSEEQIQEIHHSKPVLDSPRTLSPR